MVRKIGIGVVFLALIVALAAWVVLRSTENLTASLTPLPEGGLSETDFLNRSTDGNQEVLNYPLQTTFGLKPVHVMVSEGAAHGGEGVFVAKSISGSPLSNDDGTMAVLESSAMQNGVIEVELNSSVSQNASILTRMVARAFAGICFHVSDDGEHFECIYLRPENGNAEDETRRGHAVQYVASPDWDFQALRDAAPEKYENPADIAPGRWIGMRIEINGPQANLFIDGGTEPVLQVDDLKLGGEATGNVALWVGLGTHAFFRNLKITKQN